RAFIRCEVRNRQLVWLHIGTILCLYRVNLFINRRVGVHHGAGRFRLLSVTISRIFWYVILIWHAHPFHVYGSRPTHPKDSGSKMVRPPTRKAKRSEHRSHTRPP